MKRILRFTGNLILVTCFYFFSSAFSNHGFTESESIGSPSMMYEALDHKINESIQNRSTYNNTANRMVKVCFPFDTSLPLTYDSTLYH